MMRGARKEIGLEAGQTVMIGDTMHTDILGGLATRLPHDTRTKWVDAA